MEINHRNAIDMNNSALPHIERGNFKTASRILIRALGVATQQNCNINIVQRHVSNPPMNETLDKWMTNIFVDDLNEKDIDGNGADDDGDRNCEDCFIYQHPIAIPAIVDHNYAKYQESIKAAIFFNLAIVNHQQALVTLTYPEPTYIQNAIKVYELALQTEKVVSAAAERYAPKFRMTILNNLGAIYRILDDRVASRNYFRESLSLLMIMIDCGYCEGTQMFHSGFLRNVLFLYSQPCTAGGA